MFLSFLNTKTLKCVSTTLYGGTKLKSKHSPSQVELCLAPQEVSPVVVYIYMFLPLMAVTLLLLPLIAAVVVLLLCFFFLFFSSDAGDAAAASSSSSDGVASCSCSELVGGRVVKVGKVGGTAQLAPLLPSHNSNQVGGRLGRVGEVLHTHLPCSPVIIQVRLVEE